ncbi:GNAT family N-acetyltransferase [Streptomyces sp. NPDC127097]|uniref:GNAT family N-acetyltransferase n=1 Tax=Streptomyces sp. NPDC127097 TaxID=3347136 RepID=UPI003658E5C1
MNAPPGRGAPPGDRAVTVPLTVRELTPADLPGCGWSGSPLHLTEVERQLARARRGEVDYLAVCPPSGEPVAIGGVDHLARPDAGLLWQLAVLPALRCCGIGSVLIAAAEDRIRDRGVHRAELAVEVGNPRARALYERLGYRAYGRRPEAWDEQGPDGAVRRHETMCTLMRKEL